MAATAGNYNINIPIDTQINLKSLINFVIIL